MILAYTDDPAVIAAVKARRDAGDKIKSLSRLAFQNVRDVEDCKVVELHDGPHPLIEAAYGAKVVPAYLPKEEASPVIEEAPVSRRRRNTVESE